MATNIFKWRRLVSVCRRIHVVLYDNNDIRKAKAHLNSLKTMLDGVPQDGAIIEAEARALYYELSGDIASAIDWRLREVSLIECLHRSIAEGDYDDGTREWALRGYGQEVLQQRLEIIKNLQNVRN